MHFNVVHHLNLHCYMHAVCVCIGEKQKLITKRHFLFARCLNGSQVGIHICILTMIEFVLQFKQHQTKK
jgi:hypothetical protein